jgi:hypothetical protein
MRNGLRGLARRAAAAAVIVWASPLCSPAAAKTIGISMELSATPHGDRLSVVLKVTNSGDESAKSVVPNVHFRGHEVRAPVRPSLGPGERIETSLDLPWERATPGQWPLTIRVDYQDANGHPFQAHHVAVISSPDATPGLIPVIDVAAEPIAFSGTVRARLKSLSDAAHRSQVQFFVPRGLEVDPALRTLTVEPWADVEVRADIVNRGALPGSRYPVYVAVEYDDPGGHHAAVAHTMVEVRPETRREVPYFWIAGGLVAVWMATLAWRRWGYLRRAYPRL